MTVSIQLLNGAPLIRSGSIATHEDCCCTPSCIPNECVIPSSAFCKYCWDSACNEGDCLELQSIEFSIDNITEPTAIPSFVPDTDFCRSGWDCNCDVLNATFIHDFTTGVPNNNTIKNTCQTFWSVRDGLSPIGNYDACKYGASLNANCGFWRIRRLVSIRVAFANQQASYTSGIKSSITFPNWTTLNSPGTNGLVCCNNYTLNAGHYVVVQLHVEGVIGALASFPITVFSDSKYFIHGYGNGAKVAAGCADDQHYPACSTFTGGTATLLASSRYYRPVGALIGPITYDGDCGSYDELCDISSAIVTVEQPDIELCEITPPPPPPP